VFIGIPTAVITTEGLPFGRRQTNKINNSGTMKIIIITIIIIIINISGYQRTNMVVKNTRREVRAGRHVCRS